MRELAQAFLEDHQRQHLLGERRGACVRIEHALRARRIDLSAGECSERLGHCRDALAQVLAQPARERRIEAALLALEHVQVDELRRELREEQLWRLRVTLRWR